MSVFITLCSFSSCSQDEVTYSCDKEVNTWVKSNKSKIKRMNRSEWKKLPSHLAKSVYIAFSAKQKMEFWLDKINEVQTLGWSNDEKAHIRKIAKFIIGHPQYFNDELLTDKQLDEIEMFFYIWKTDAIKKWGWSDKLCYAIAGSGLQIKNRKGDFENQTIYENKLGLDKYNPQFDPSKPSVPNCNCNQSADFCMITTCVKSKCSEVKGCGWLCLQTCNGECEVGILP